MATKQQKKMFDGKGEQRLMAGELAPWLTTIVNLFFSLAEREVSRRKKGMPMKTCRSYYFFLIVKHYVGRRPGQHAMWGTTLAKTA